MIKQVIEYVNKFKEEHSTPFERILEVGSRAVAGGGNATDIRSIFSDAKEYIGVDLSAGKNVDIVMDGHDIRNHFEENSFDLVLCFETLEHDDKFWWTVENMKWVLKPGGWMIITVPGPHCPFHEWPGDYWRFMKQGVYSMFDRMAEILVDDFCWDLTGHTPPNACAVMGKGMKP